MFTGIIESLGQIVHLDRREQETTITVNTSFSDLSLGESVAINGVCLTVAELPAPEHATFYVSPETIRCTNFAALDTQTKVNLERALAVGARMSGHWVQGHVDAVGEVTSRTQEQDSVVFELDIPPSAARYCVAKGSIALDGVSLTLNQVQQNTIQIQIIPHTLQATNLAEWQPGTKVNVETDILAKYMEKLCQTSKMQ